jgi:uncharacterized phage protein gp47/JayE
MFDPTKAIENLQAEIDRTLKEIAKAKGVDEKLKWSELLNHLTASIGVYFDFVISSMAAESEMWDEEEDEDR